MEAYAVELQEVEKEYPYGGLAGESVAAVREVTLQIRDGEFFSLPGPSGCGKTTTALHFLRALKRVRWFL